VLAYRRYGVRDTGILSALALHPTGAPGMRLLDKILFVADYAEPLRAFAAAARLRRLAAKNLDAAVAAAARSKAAYLLSRGAVLHPRSRALLAFLKKRR
jgi:HD superfamily phosphohydrolase YqeK